MGYEYGVVFSLPLQTPQLDQLRHCLQTYLLRYAYLPAGTSAWPEDFLLEVSNQRIYLLLHTATADQTTRVLAWLEHCAATLGLAGALVEL
jgi:hypothetical protein